MGIGTSIFLLAVGAILKFAVSAETEGVDLAVVGTILMLVGGLGILLSLFFWDSWGGFRRREVVVGDGVPARRRAAVYEDEVV